MGVVSAIGFGLLILGTPGVGRQNIAKAGKPVTMS